MLNKMTLPPSGDPVFFPIPDVALVGATDDTGIHYFGRVEVDFTDAVGNRLHRDVNGRLNGPPKASPKIRKTRLEKIVRFTINGR